MLAPPRKRIWMIAGTVLAIAVILACNISPFEPLQPFHLLQVMIRSS